MPVKNQSLDIVTMLTDDSVPLEQRLELVLHLAMHDHKHFSKVFETLLVKACAANGKDLYAKKLKKLKDMIAEMEAGPLRCARFVDMVPRNGTAARAQVVLLDGTWVSVVVPDPALADSLVCGDTVLIDSGGKALVRKGLSVFEAGEEARFERRTTNRTVEVTLRDHERYVFLMGKTLADKVDRGEVKRDDCLLVCSRLRMAFDVIPKADGPSRYRYISDEPIPLVDIERDIGCPPAFLEEVIRHVHREMVDPEFGRRYRIRRFITKLLTGPSGTGKTLCIQGLIRRSYEIMSEVCGVPIDALPRRVMRIRSSKLLSEWLGVSDKNIDRFFDELEELTGDKFVAPDGTEYELPVIVCFEEADSLGRVRGQETIYDRIQTTLLQRLDPTARDLNEKLIICFFTTNVESLLDPAFFRRAGGTVERFGRLNKRAFLAVLSKRMRDLPLALVNGLSPEQTMRQLMNDLASWLFSPNGDRGLVELQFANAATPVVKHRRDLLTGALVDRAVVQACARACEADRAGCDHPGLSVKLLMTALDRQIRAIADSLDVGNAPDYLALPDGARVTSVRRLEQPGILPAQLESAPIQESRIVA